MLSTHPSPLELVDQVESDLRELARGDFARLPSDVLSTLVLRLQKTQAIAQAAALAATAAFDASGAWELDGAANAASWIRARANLTSGAARAQVREGRLLRDLLPLTAAALADGRITAAHVRVLTAVCDKHPERRDTIRDAEPTLVAAAHELDPTAFRQVVDRWTTAVDPAAACADDAERHEARWVSASRTFGGMVRLDGLLDPEGGAVVLDALRALMRSHCDQDDRRTQRQRRADALVDLARLALDSGDLPQVAGERPHLTVTIPIGVIRRELTGGAELVGTGPLTADAALRLLCDSALIPVLHSDDGAVLDVGRSRRTIPPAIRRAVVHRDGGCIFTGCDRSPEHCDVHHLQEWSQGGKTAVSNCVLLCRRHHRAIHQEGFCLVGTPAEGMRTIRPNGTRIDLGRADPARWRDDP